jgi:molybdopterin-guanine dinucleotide biosynthesis protein B
MMLARAVSVIGYKNSGKTRVVEALVRELTDRGHRVGTLKHTAEDVLLDTPGKDTWRHREAGSRATAILHGRGSAFFIDRFFTVNEAVSRLGGLDFVVLEGFKSLETMAKIIVPREAGEIEGLSNGLEIAMADLAEGGLRAQGDVPVVSLDGGGELADIVEARAFPMLPGLDCHGCGYEDCLGLGRAILAGEASVDKCVGIAPGFTLRVDGEVVPLGPFVQDVTRGVVLGLVKSFKGVEAPSRVELEFETGGKDG